MSKLPVILFGMRCVGTPPALRALLAAGYDVRALVMPGPPGGPPLTTLTPTTGNASIPLSVVSNGDTSAEIEEFADDLARAVGIPVLLASDLRHASVVAALAAFEPALIAVSCFTLFVPRVLRELPRYGCLNVHPALLPHGRGVEPVFWTIRNGETETGVTIHLMDAGYDSGPILLQEIVPVPTGIRLPDFERELSERGAHLLIRAIGGLIAGDTQPVPQDDKAATFAPDPTPADYEVSTDRPATWAYNFFRAVAPLDGPLTLTVSATGERIPVRDALSFSPVARQVQPVIREGEVISVQFSPGVVHCRV